MMIDTRLGGIAVCHLILGSILISTNMVAVGAWATDMEPSANNMVTPAAERSIERGLKYLAAAQHEDGSLGSGQMRGNVAICALTGMAMIAAGSTPGRGPYGENVNLCVDYLLSCSQPSGFIAGPDASRGPMYGHGYAVLFLAECYGMTTRDELRDALTKAVSIIINSQNSDGGWRYHPVRADADISVTACQVMALRAARNGGLFVPAECIDRAIGYVNRSQNADGGFMYMIQGGESAFPRSAAAVTALYGAGVYEGRELQKGLEYLKKFLPGTNVTRNESYYYYAQYYAAQAMWQAGGEYWNRWYPAARDELIARQNKDGSWQDPSGNECATAMALIALQIPNNYLPIFQR